jgi:CRISPR-associated endonuclease Cas1
MAERSSLTRRPTDGETRREDNEAMNDAPSPVEEERLARQGDRRRGTEARNRNILFVDCTGATIVSRGGRLYVRHRGEYAEVETTVRVIVASGFGFVITSDAIGVCARRHVEVIVTSFDQGFTAIYAPYVPGLSSRSCLALRARQFAAVADRRKGLTIAKGIMRRKIVAESHPKTVQGAFLADLAACRSMDEVRHVEAKSAQEWWQRWRDFKIDFVKGFKPPEQWRTFQTRYIGRAQGKTGELAKQFTPRFAETPLQALHNFAVGIAVARITRVIAVRGLDPCFGFLHDGRKPGRYSLTWDAVEVFRPVLAEAVFAYAGVRKFDRADFATQDGVVRLSSWIARECADMACKTASPAMLVKEVRRIERML